MIEEVERKAVLITGGAKRIGCELALMLASKGYDIAISYNKSQEEAEKLSKKIRQDFKVRCEIFCCDLRDQKQTQILAESVLKVFPAWNLLINNASIFNESKFLSSPDSLLEENLNIHFRSPLILSKFFAQHVLSAAIEGAQIINMLDKNIVRFNTRYFHYLLSKKFLAEATKMLALELAPKIRVNGIAPGFILNSVNEKNPNSETQNLLQKIPLRTRGGIVDICRGIEFLLESSFVTGQIIFIDGGAGLVN